MRGSTQSWLLCRILSRILEHDAEMRFGSFQYQPIGVLSLVEVEAMGD